MDAFHASVAQRVLWIKRVFHDGVDNLNGRSGPKEHTLIGTTYTHLIDLWNFMMNKDRHAGLLRKTGISRVAETVNLGLPFILCNVFCLNIVRYFSLVLIFCVTPFGDRIILKSIRNCDNNLTNTAKWLPSNDCINSILMTFTAQIWVARLIGRVVREICCKQSKALLTSG